MAVFAASASNDFKAKISSANEAVLILGSENHLQFNLEKNMDQIRSTIMQQEALFREQVQALHKLYDVQKSAMQEIKKSIFSPAQKWVYNYESVTIGDNSLCGSILVVKPLRPASANAESYKEESLALSLHPFYALKEVQSCDSLCMNSHGANTSYSSQSKPTRNFDLEKLPEYNVDESQNEVKSNSSTMPDINSTLTNRTLDRDANRFLGADLSVKMDSPSPTQVYPEPDFRTPSSPSQKINQDCDQALGGNVCGVDEKCATGISKPE
ncbi:hypothetical protein F0562_012329 [Nyssa sinensis]|uniref:Uncharacterized protein n=1 Tax=Nyssa sinensis TaxID=561372 RepID=A0A5J4ZX39_9ASTE|nr:hypothetical protein F0562_012329 [Nyssa sinensis]